MSERVLAPIIAFVVLPAVVWAWSVGMLESLAGIGTVLGSAIVLTFVGWWLWLILSQELWPALCKFGNWLGRP